MSGKNGNPEVAVAAEVAGKLRKVVKRTIDQEIATAREKLKKLEEQQREIQKREREKSERLIRDFIKDEKLDAFEIDAWRAAASDIRSTLEKAAAKISQSVKK